jgi:hypothetical protein
MFRGGACSAGLCWFRCFCSVMGAEMGWGPGYRASWESLGKTPGCDVVVWGYLWPPDGYEHMSVYKIRYICGQMARKVT